MSENRQFVVRVLDVAQGAGALVQVDDGPPRWLSADDSLALDVPAPSPDAVLLNANAFHAIRAAERRLTRAVEDGTRPLGARSSLIEGIQDALVVLQRALRGAPPPTQATDRESELQDDLVRRDEQVGRAMTLLRRVWDESGEGTGVVCRQTGANHWSDVVRWVSDSPEVEEPTSDPSQDERRTPIAAGWGRERSTLWVCPCCRQAHEITGATWLDCACGAQYRFVYHDEPEADEPARWSGWSDEELDRLGQMLGDGGHELADLQAERRRRHAEAQHCCTHDWDVIEHDGVPVAMVCSDCGAKRKVVSE